MFYFLASINLSRTKKKKCGTVFALFFFQGFDSGHDFFMISGLPHVLYFLYYGKIRILSCIFQYFVDLSCIVLFFRYISYQNESCLLYSLKIVLLIEKTSSFVDFI